MQPKPPDSVAVSYNIAKYNKLLTCSAVEMAFVLGIRALEFTLGIICDDTFATGILTDSIALPAFTSAIPIIARLAMKYGIGPPNSFDMNDLMNSSGVLSMGYLNDFLGRGRQRQCLSTQ